MNFPDNCGRCGGSLGEPKTFKMSWFTEEDLCTSCQNKEEEIKKALRDNGQDLRKLEGCGKVPLISNSGKFIVED